MGEQIPLRVRRVSSPGAPAYRMFPRGTVVVDALGVEWERVARGNGKGSWWACLDPNLPGLLPHTTAKLIRSRGPVYVRPVGGEP